MQKFPKILAENSKKPLDGIVGKVYDMVKIGFLGFEISASENSQAAIFDPGGELGSTGYRKSKLRVVVGQQAT